jgi:hypothetical protein
MVFYLLLEAKRTMPGLAIGIAGRDSNSINSLT